MNDAIKYNREVTMILCISLTYDSGSLSNAFATGVSSLTTTIPNFDQWFVLERVASIWHDIDQDYTTASISQSTSRGRQATSTSGLKVADSK